MPRRVYTYPASLGLDSLNLLATIGAFVLAVGFLVFVVNVLYAARYGREAAANPWGGDTLEWSLPSPPGFALYARIPVVSSRHPLWEQEDCCRPPRNVRNAIVEALDHRPERLAGDAFLSM